MLYILYSVFYIIIYVLYVFCWWETRTQRLPFRAPEAFSGQLYVVSGVKHCCVFMGLCSGNLL